MIEPGSWPSTPLADEDFPLSHAQNVRNSETVVRALAKGFWLPHDVLRERLFALRHSRNWVERRGAVLILGSECSQVSGVFEFICARAENDDNVRVRAAAIRMLAEHFADRSAVFDIIQRCSAEAKDDWTREGWVVARTAIDMLVSRFADQTWHLLEGLTESDDESTRASAIQMLGENLSHRPAVVALLLRCAEADRSLWVRECAERALAAYFAQLAGSLAFFNQQAHNEPSALARRYATLEWARRQTSNLRRMLLARKLSLGASDMGIDPHDMIDSDRIIAAARECFQSPNAIRSEYERIVRDDGFPLRLSWLERGN
jgi:hypothetical protein